MNIYFFNKLHTWLLLIGRAGIVAYSDGALRELVRRIGAVNGSVHAIRDGQVEAVEGGIGVRGGAVAWAGQAVESICYCPEPEIYYNDCSYP